ncbi:MAG: PGF-pre-PGF domain-containing protein, partial [Nanoarchaeota archaeon]
NNVMLMRYVDGKWTELATTKLSSDNNYLYYTAKSTGFSFFAIAEKRNPDVALDQEPETAPENNETQAQTNEAQEPPKEESQNNFVVFLITAAVVLALGLVFFVFKSNENKKKIKKT